MSNHIIQNDYIFHLKFMKVYMIHFGFGRSKNIVFNVWDHLLGKGLWGHQITPISRPKPHTR